MAAQCELACSVPSRFRRENEQYAEGFLPGVFLRLFSIVAAAHLVLGVAALRALQLGLIFALGEPLSFFGFLCGSVGRGCVSRLFGHLADVARMSGLAPAYLARSVLVSVQS
jgi:hypothetical protein